MKKAPNSTKEALRGHVLPDKQHPSGTSALGFQIRPPEPEKGSALASAILARMKKNDDAERAGGVIHDLSFLL